MATVINILNYKRKKNNNNNKTDKTTNEQVNAR